MHPNQALARRELEVVQAGDIAALGNLYADDFVLHLRQTATCLGGSQGPRHRPGALRLAAQLRLRLVGGCPRAVAAGLGDAQ
jgi:ketosteroid isomerase-like protein